MKVLIGCEYSGIVRDAFIKKGHQAVSCDLLPTESPGPHIVGDVLEAIKSRQWDFIGLHIPCTAMAVSGNRWYGRGQKWHHKRIEAVEWTLEVWRAVKDHARAGYLENPVSVIFSHIKEPVQYIQPWQFGHGEQKNTGLALYNLNKLEPTNIVEGREQKIWKMPPSKDRAKQRSKTYPGVADAFAEQWSF